MGGQDKQQLAKLLGFVKAVYDNPENADFARGLRMIVERDIDNHASRLRNIEKYLSLDFKIDSAYNPVYSFIDGDYLREKLNADFREMLRYRLGTRGHKIDFNEFCRFAVLQIEMLVNYYYDKRYNNDISLVKQALLDGSHQLVFSEKLNYVSEIPLKTKIFGLRKELGFKNSNIDIYLYAIDVRNRQSHRSLIVYKDRIKETEKYLIGIGVMGRNGYIDYGKIPEKDKAMLKEYQFEKWYDEMPFDKVVDSISVLAKTIEGKLR